MSYLEDKSSSLLPYLEDTGPQIQICRTWRTEVQPFSFLSEDTIPALFCHPGGLRSSFLSYLEDSYSLFYFEETSLAFYYRYLDDKSPALFFCRTWRTQVQAHSAGLVSVEVLTQEPDNSLDTKMTGLVTVTGKESFCT
jgi:hypothetical protein